MATKLGLYNDALRHLGERKLATLTEQREPRRVLDDAYTSAVNYCLEQGFWKFAQRTKHVFPDTSVAITFGYPYAFAKPVDNVKLFRICADEFFKDPLLDYGEEGPYWFSHLNELYISYISNDPIYGNDLTRWPETFTRYVGYYLASEVADRIAPSVDISKIVSLLEQAKNNAMAKDALQGPVEFLPQGSWTLSRGRGSFGSRDCSRWNGKFV